MDDPAGEDDVFYDDDLDALPDLTFHQLQQNAVNSTQQPSLSAQVHLPIVKQTTGLPSGLERLSVTGSADHVAKQSALQAPSSDYGDFDDDMLDGQIFDAADEPALAVRYEAGTREQESGESSQRERWRLQRYGPNQRSTEPIRQRISHQGAVDLPLNNGNGLGGPNATVQEGGTMHLVHESQTCPTLQETADVVTLQAQVQKVGLLKAQFNGIACLYFYSAAK